MASFINTILHCSLGRLFYAGQKSEIDLKSYKVIGFGFLLCRNIDVITRFMSLEVATLRKVRQFM